MPQPVAPASVSSASNASGPSSGLLNVDKIIRAIREFFTWLYERACSAWNALTSRRVMVLVGVSSAMRWVSPSWSNRFERWALLGLAGYENIRAANAEAHRDKLRIKNVAQSKEIASLRADAALRENDALRVEHLQRTVQKQREAELAAIPARVDMEAELAKAREAAERSKQDVAAAKARTAKAEAERDEAVAVQRELRLRASREAVDAICVQIAQARGKGQQPGALLPQLLSAYTAAHEAHIEELERAMQEFATSDSNYILLSASKDLMKAFHDAVSTYADMDFDPQFSECLEGHTESCEKQSKELLKVSQLSQEPKTIALLQGGQKLMDDSFAMARRVNQIVTA